MKIAFEINSNFLYDHNFIVLLAKIGVGAVCFYILILMGFWVVESYNRQIAKEHLQELKEQGKL